MRFTSDNNILVRSTHRASGPARRLLELVRHSPQHRLVLSPAILSEVREVLLRPRLQVRHGMSPTEVEEFVEDLATLCVLVKPEITKPIVEQDADDMVLYTAIAGEVEVLCTLDRHFYAGNVLAFCAAHGIQVMSDVEFLQELLRGRWHN